MRTRARWITEVDRLDRLTHSRFKLDESVNVLIEEHRCKEPGSPPQMVQIQFVLDEVPHQLTVFKPVEQITQEDYPPAWILISLQQVGAIGCSCC